MRIFNKLIIYMILLTIFLIQRILRMFQTQINYIDEDFNSVNRNKI